MTTLRIIVLALVAQVIGACAGSDWGWSAEPAESTCEPARCPAGTQCDVSLGVCASTSAAPGVLELGPTHLRISGLSADVVLVSQSPATGGRGEDLRVVLVPLDSEAPPQELATLSAEDAARAGRWLLSQSPRGGGAERSTPADTGRGAGP